MLALHAYCVYVCAFLFVHIPFIQVCVCLCKRVTCVLWCMSLLLYFFLVKGEPGIQGFPGRQGMKGEQVRLNQCQLCPIVHCTYLCIEGRTRASVLSNMPRSVSMRHVMYSLEHLLCQKVYNCGCIHFKACALDALLGGFSAPHYDCTLLTAIVKPVQDSHLWVSSN